MAHRGRLNVLANIMDKNVREIFAAFEDGDPERYLGRGDVKYHLGYSTDRTHGARASNVHLTLAFNPSHLEFVNPVVEGRVRAKQDRRGDRDRAACMPLLIHGDAAFMGQGVVAETLNLAGLEGYTHRRHRPRRRQQPDRLHDRSRATRARRATRPTSRACSRCPSST